MNNKWSLRSFITGVRQEDNWGLPPEELTKLVLHELPPEREREALEQAVRHVVSSVVSSGPSGDQPYLRAVPKPASERDSARSWRTSASRRRWQTYLEDPLDIVPGRAGYRVAFGDCTVDDLVKAAAKRRDVAAGLTTTAGVLDGWCELLVKHGVRRVRELPEHVLRPRLEQQRPA